MAIREVYTLSAGQRVRAGGNLRKPQMGAKDGSQVPEGTAKSIFGISL